MMKLLSDFAERVHEYGDEESGMEAAQVILILFLVVIGLIPIIMTIRDRLANRATSIYNTIPTS